AWWCCWEWGWLDEGPAAWTGTRTSWPPPSATMREKDMRASAARTSMVLR
ncbi:uncharacterized protein B0H18DRAFT_1023144, partial [Fomitopsis serialis]